MAGVLVAQPAPKHCHFPGGHGFDPHGLQNFILRMGTTWHPMNGPCGTITLVQHIATCQSLTSPHTMPTHLPHPDPGFNSKSAPTSPNYWPFRKHLRGRCSLTQSSYGGLQDRDVYNQREYQVDPIQE
jgi:hypothetical protein